MSNSDGALQPTSDFDELAIRRALSEFATGVTIVATHDGEPVGFACQSFSSLSLEPPLVLFTVMKSSQSWPRIKATGRFSVSVLTEDQQGLSTAFGRRSPNKFEHGTWAMTDLGNPVLDDCAVWFDCTLDAVHEAGDHFIVVGALKTIGRRDAAKPLIYHRGSYARVVAAGADAPNEQKWRQRPSV